MDRNILRIKEWVNQHPIERIQNLSMFINYDNLLLAISKVDGTKVTGIDKVTKDMYFEKKEEYLDNLVKRLKYGDYKPIPSKRVYIPKTGSNKKRPIGIPSFEDKIVQVVIAEILEIIYEPLFLDNSYGFRPNKNCHQAVQEIVRLIQTKKVNNVCDMDIKGFFDNVNHEWMIKFLEYRINDKKFIDLISKFLKAGIMEYGKYYDTEKGTPQGGIISPILANIYLHFVLDLWFKKRFKNDCKGEAYLIRYADDFVCLFQKVEDAKAFTKELNKRVSEFGLEVSQEKSKTIEFGRFAIENRNKRGESKPETFDFLGFTFYCSISYNTNVFVVKVKTDGRKLRSKFNNFREWIKKVRTFDIEDIIKVLKSKLLGHYRYYGVTYNFRGINKYYHYIRKELYKWLNRRSQKKSYNWEQFDNKVNEEWNISKPRLYINLLDYVYS